MRLVPALLPALLAFALSAPVSGSETVIGNRDSAALAAAIDAANARPGLQRITLAEGGIYTFDGARPESRLPEIRGRLVIDGKGAEIRRYGKGPITLIDVAEGGELTLIDLTLAEGNRGAIRNMGELHLQSVQVIDSSGDGLRGVVVNHGRLVAIHSVFAWNRVDAAGRDGGTLVNHGDLRLQHSRIEGNRVSRRWPSLAAGAAVLNLGRLRIDEVEFVDNAIDDDFGGLAGNAILNLDSGRIDGAPQTLLTEERAPLAAR